MQIADREISEEVLSRIRERVRSDATLTRSALSREVCEWMGWLTLGGRPKEVSCRLRLQKLQRLGVIELPAAREGSFKRRTHSAEEAPNPEFVGSLDELGPVTLVRVDSTQRELSRAWWQLMDAHHPLGGGPLCGAQLRYLVKSDVGVLGGLSFSAAARHLEPRDAWIGWDKGTRERGLQKVIGNSRFLIAPGVRVPHLASHVLAQALKRLSADWQSRYDITPMLVETFVDPTHYRGTCYQAANWQHLGQTQGRGRQDRSHAAKGTSKDIWVYPLHPNWREILLGASAPRPTKPDPTQGDWAQQEFGGCKLPDARLQKRLLIMARDFYAHPSSSLPQACDGYRDKTKAAYRFIDHEHITMDILLQPHYRATQARITGERVVLAVQDTTSLNYSAHAATEGLGPISTTPDGPQGLQLHSTLCFDEGGTPLGFIDVQCWARDPGDFGKKARRHEVPIEEKESYKWLKSLEATAKVQAQAKKTLMVNVGDREADIYELFERAATEHPQGPKLLVRARHDRKLHEQQALWATMEGRAVDAIQELEVARQGARPERIAQLEIRYASVTLQAPARLKGPPLPIWAVFARERDAPKGVEPLEWMLLTTVEVASAQDACERLRWYACRWGIEVLHRTLKSGCRIEDRQFGTADRIEACLAIDLVVAWRIFCLTKLARDKPDAPCTIYFEDAEWEAVKVLKTKKRPPTKVPTLREITRDIASLGGFLGRKADGEPGTQALWRGLARVADIKVVYAALSEKLNATQVAVSSKPTSG